jgi:hypothetical protein
MNIRAKEKALTEFDREFDSLRTLLRTFEADVLERSVAVQGTDGWHIRDLLPHIAEWQHRAALAARKVAAEGLHPAPDDRVRTVLGIGESVDELNDATFKEWHERNAREQMTYLSRAHEEMMGALNALTPEQLMNGEGIDSVYACFRVPGLEHVRTHRAHIEAALGKEGATT